MQENDAMNSLSYSKLNKYIEKAHPRQTLIDPESKGKLP